MEESLGKKGREMRRKRGMGGLEKMGKRGGRIGRERMGKMNGSEGRGRRRGEWVRKGEGWKEERKGDAQKRKKR